MGWGTGSKDSKGREPPVRSRQAGARPAAEPPQRAGYGSWRNSEPEFRNAPAPYRPAPSARPPARQRQPNCVLLIRFSDDDDSRTYRDFTDTKLAMMTLCEMYEQTIKLNAPTLSQVSYTLDDIMGFIDRVNECSCFERSGPGYVLRDREWIKGQLEDTLCAESKG